MSGAREPADLNSSTQFKMRTCPVYLRKAAFAKSAWSTTETGSFQLASDIPPLCFADRHWVRLYIIFRAPVQISLMCSVRHMWQLMNLSVRLNKWNSEFKDKVFLHFFFARQFNREKGKSNYQPCNFYLFLTFCLVRSRFSVTLFLFRSKNSFADVNCCCARWKRRRSKCYELLLRGCFEVSAPWMKL